MRKILIIDDDEKLQNLLQQYLHKNGFETESAFTASRGIALAKAQSPHLIILDIMLPESNGFEVCKTIRSFSTVPIIMLTARGDTTDKIIGLEIGADDYLAKPFEPRELLARMETILRRVQSGENPHKMIFEDLVIDPAFRAAQLGSEDLELSTAEFDLLATLAQKPGKKFTRDELLTLLKVTEWAAVEKSVDVLVSRLRQTLHDNPKQPTYIKTIWGTGYMFIARPSDV